MDIQVECPKCENTEYQIPDSKYEEVFVDRATGKDFTAVMVGTYCEICKDHHFYPEDIIKNHESIQIAQSKL